ncbi:hypothetical protein LXA47_20810 [Massilia sp. P8910]|uniref:hypothetical protein n=1 Tax=Massilia antarctica TaxID=2765360 RepID=UPI001E49B3BC|nr:hypothetical protein [Massilia antarctica]MCE3606028.1 hypothetical protein [Massilia antarctica]
MKFPFLIAMMLAAGIATAQEAEAVKEVDTVQVNALRDPDFKTYRAFVAGLDAFDSKHALAGYRMVAGERNVTAPAGAVGPDGMTYVVPLHDASWPDDALVEFEFAEQT